MSVFENDTEKQDFNLELVRDSFKKCMQESEQTVLLEDYLKAFHELCRFFKLTGTLLGFVAKDIEGKIKSVEQHVHSKQGRHYRSVQAMIKFEETKGITHQKWMQPSGCRMLLRLHQALEFILEFMERLRLSEEQEKMSVMAWEVYRQTLYHHHPWVTRKVAQVAVYGLPSKKHLIDVMCKQDYGTVLGLLAEVVNAGKPVWEATQRLLSSHDLLHIP
ncbi:ceramide-1-phosphate transfer protein-like [Elysia marginata]|uniref:Ceramide-1-phosphate transfer protein-like n=1 Tax=Elysia marginata TaxID=1093978 RepID=A0AAV4FYE3_9GAST|nr:ceramide-1-phosphate transfer protein-like [Elysia marginata]